MNDMPDWFVSGGGAAVAWAIIKLIEELMKYRAAARERAAAQAALDRGHEMKAEQAQVAREDELADRYTDLLAENRTQLEAEMREWREAYQRQVEKRFVALESELQAATKAVQDARNQAEKYQKLYFQVAETNINAARQITVLQGQLSELRQRIQAMSEEFAVEREDMEVLNSRMRDRMEAVEQENERLHRELKRYTDTGPLRPLGG